MEKEDTKCGKIAMAVAISSVLKAGSAIQHKFKWNSHCLSSVKSGIFLNFISVGELSAFLFSWELFFLSLRNDNF